MSEPFLAEIKLFGLNFAVRGWAFCDGQLQSISQNSALFSLLGTTYGGDGRTTFGLPDMRGRVPIHSGNGSQGPGLSSYRLGQKGGAEDTTLTVQNMPSHNHDATSTSSMNVTGAPGDTQTGTGSYLAAGTSIYSGSSGLGLSAMNAESVTTNTALENTGGSQAFSNVQPYLAVNFEIALQGIFPSRS